MKCPVCGSTYIDSVQKEIGVYKCRTCDFKSTDKHFVKVKNFERGLTKDEIKRLSEGIKNKIKERRIA